MLGAREFLFFCFSHDCHSNYKLVSFTHTARTSLLRIDLFECRTRLCDVKLDQQKNSITNTGTAQLLRESWAAELFTYFYQNTLDDCNDHMNMRQAPQSFHWDMTMDWFREVRGRSIDNMFVNVSRPILAMSSSKYTLARIRRLDCDNVITVRVNGLSGDILPSCEKSDLKKMHDAIEAFSSENMMLLPFLMESGLDDSPIFIESMKMDDDDENEDDDAIKPSD